MKESTYLYKHCLRSLDYVQIHTTGTDTSLKPDNLFPEAQILLFPMLSSLVYKAMHGPISFLTQLETEFLKT